MRVCLNCVSYDPKVAQQCRDRRAEPVAEKHAATFCEYFDFIRRTFAGPEAAGAREAKARADLKRLLGD